MICIHIPPDASGLLRDQSLVTSGLVPRSVSRESYSCIAVQALCSLLSLAYTWRGILG
ncbi:MAG: hypothetical protein LBF66_00490 [Holosporales bacterium]|nr:hypothetical protein [Holosporales bacterium]